MDDINRIEIRKATIYDWEPAMELAWNTFLKFEADAYGPEGTKNFRDFVTDADLRRMFIKGNYPTFVALDGSEYAGMISVRNQGHISLLFVDEKFHKRGIGRLLINIMQNFVKTEFGMDVITVNAAPYAVPFYHRVGFVDIGPEMTTDGIIYTPMEKKIV